MSTPDTSCVTKYYQSNYNQRCCLHWMLCGETNLDRKLLPRSIYDVLTQISNDFQLLLYRVQADFSCCGASGVDTVLLTYREETKQPRRPIAGLPLLEFSPALESWSHIYTGSTSCLIVPQTFSSFVFLSAISIFLSLLGSANVSPVHWMLSPPHHE